MTCDTAAPGCGVKVGCGTNVGVGGTAVSGSTITGDGSASGVDEAKPGIGVGVRPMMPQPDNNVKHIRIQIARNIARMALLLANTGFTSTEDYWVPLQEV